MKYVKPLFCLEILFVLVGCTRVYMKWDLPLYVPILIGTIAVALCIIFTSSKQKVRKVAQYRVKIKTLGKIPSVFHYFKFSGFKASNSGTTKRPSLRISTSSK